MVKNNYTEHFVDYVRTDNQRVAEIIMYKLDENNNSSIDKLAKKILLDGQPASLILTNHFGQQIYPKKNSLEKVILPDEDFFFAENKDNLYHINSTIKSSKGQHLAYMQLAYNESYVIDELNNLYRNVIFIAITYLFIVILFTSIVDIYITQPLRNLTRGANKIASGKYNQLFHNNTNISEIKQLTESLETMRNELVMRGKKLQNSEQRIRTLVDNITDAVIVCDFEGNILSSNRALLALTNYQSAPVNINKIINLYKIIDYIKKSPAERLFEDIIITQAKTRIPVEVNISELIQDDKILLLVLLRDISERKRNELEHQQYYSEMAHAGRLSIMGEMAAGLAHELNQPLTAISVYLQGCLRLLTPANEDLQKTQIAIKKANEQATRAANIIRRIRNFVHKGSDRENYKIIDINKLICRSVDFAMLDKKQAFFQPELALSEKSLLAKIDSLQIELVLINLIRNAFEAMSNQDTKKMLLKITSCINKNGNIQITVIDSGEGVLEKNIEKIFDTYFTTKREGLGMGLAICRTILEEYNGDLWCNNKLKTGSEFCLTLPRHYA